MRRLLLCAVMLAAPLAQAMDLREAFDRARQVDPAFQAAGQELAALAQAVPLARAGLLPNASFNANRNRIWLDRQDNGLSSESNYYSQNTTLQLRQPLWRRAQWVQLQQAQTQAGTEDVIRQRALGDLLLRVASAYFDLLYARQGVSYVQAVSAASDQQLRAARRSFELGQGTRTDIDEAQARYDQAQAQGVQARQNEHYALRQLAILVGPFPGRQPHGLPLDAEPARVEGDLSVWLERARSYNPDVRLANSRKALAELEVRKTQAGHDPTVDLVAQRAISKSENTQFPRSGYFSSQIGVQLSMPIYAGGATEASVSQAVANLERERFLFEQTVNDVQLKLQREFQSLAEGSERLQAARQALHSASQLAISTAKGIQAGTRTVMDRLNAEQRKADALRELALVHYQLQLARLRLAVLAGEDLMPVVETINRQLRATQP